jgi:hypothetical protein
MDYPGMLAIPCSLMRGGSSKGGMFLDADLPSDPGRRAAMLLASYGSPDMRQIDGIGGADPLTSKAAVVGRSSRVDADLDYTFYQVGIDSPRVSMGGTCGNMLAAVAPFALFRGLIPPPSGRSEVVARIHATNTGQVFTARFQADGGYHLVDGESAIAGVPGTSSPIRLDFGDCAGSMSGRLLPTGQERDVITIDGRNIPVSLVDAATPFVFVRATDIGAGGHELPSQLANMPEAMRRLEHIRAWAAGILGLVENSEDAAAKTPNVPRVVMVSPSIPYGTVNGEELEADKMDVCVRQLAMQRPHKALAVTGSVCTAVAARIRNSVVAECTTGTGDIVRIGHPSGVTTVRCTLGAVPGAHYKIQTAEIERTARLIMHGHVLVRQSHFDRILLSLNT